MYNIYLGDNMMAKADYKDRNVYKNGYFPIAISENSAFARILEYDLNIRYEDLLYTDGNRKLAEKHAKGNALSRIFRWIKSN